jgi:hypothetical protein
VKLPGNREPPSGHLYRAMTLGSGRERGGP